MRSAGNDIVTAAPVAVSEKEGVFTYKFQLARGSFRNSECTLSTQYYEKDGMPTVGGGELFRIHLRKFVPGAGEGGEGAVSGASED